MNRPAVQPVYMAFLVAAALVPAACGGGAPTRATPTPTAPLAETPDATRPVISTVVASPSPELTPTAAPFDGTRGPVEREGAPPTALLVDVRTGLQEGFDRIVFEFEEAPPGYHIAYVEPPIGGEFSGLPVEIGGSAFLRVSFRSAAGYDPFTADPTYEGPSEITSDLPSLLEAERTGDFEGVLTWVLGLSQEVDFRILELGDPFRVAIDVQHP